MGDRGIEGGDLCDGSVNADEQVEDIVSGLSYELPIIEHSPLPYYHAIDSTIEETDNISDFAFGGAYDNEFSAGEDSDEEYPIYVSNDNEGPDTLLLRITTDSWIEIYDSTAACAARSAPFHSVFTFGGDNAR